MASNDQPWAKANLGNDSITFSDFREGEIDMALMASCNHSIISSGTFSWWSGWLANGTVIYYENYPPMGSKMYGMYSKDDYYPNNWIPMS